MINPERERFVVDAAKWEAVAALADKMGQLKELQKEVIPVDNGHYIAVHENMTHNLDFKQEALSIAKDQLQLSEEKGDTRKIEFYKKRVEGLSDTVRKLESQVSYMRPNTEEDLIEREFARKNFSKMVDEVIPDGEPIVFHGNNNIGTVKDIIEAGGLKTPEERGADFKSFATQIDVTAKTNTRVSCEFADAGVDSFMPYGAIFAFYPKEHEYEKVLKTGDSSEVLNGVEGVDFDEDRFVGVITTKENVDSIKKLFEEKHLDTGKVFTHNQFIEHYKKDQA